jgi:hypothetical protein
LLNVLFPPFTKHTFIRRGNNLPRKTKVKPKLTATAAKIKAEMEGAKVWTRESRMEEASATKLLTIYHILSIYQDHGHERVCPIPLERYSLGELETHLGNLRRGKYPWAAPL